MESLLGKPGNHALKGLHVYLTKHNEKRIWTFAAKYFEKIEQRINEVLWQDGSVTEVKKGFSEMELELKRIGLMSHLKPPYHEHKKNLTTGTYLRETYITNPTPETPRTRGSKETPIAASHIPQDEKGLLKGLKDKTDLEKDIREENKRLKAEVDVLKERLKKMEKEKENMPRPEDVKGVKEIVKKKQEEKAAKYKENLIPVYEASIALETSIKTAEKDFGEKPATEARKTNKGRREENEIQKSSDTNVDEMISVINETINRSQQYVKSMQIEIKRKEELIAKSRQQEQQNKESGKQFSAFKDRIDEMQTICRQISESSQLGGEYEVAQPNKSRGDDYQQKFIDLYEDMRNLPYLFKKMQMRHKENPSMIATIKKEIEKVNAISTNVCDFIEKNVNEKSYGGRENVSERDTVSEDEVAIISKRPNNLSPIVTYEESMRTIKEELEKMEEKAQLLQKRISELEEEKNALHGRYKKSMKTLKEEVDKLEGEAQFSQKRISEYEEEKDTLLRRYKKSMKTLKEEVDKLEGEAQFSQKRISEYEEEKDTLLRRLRSTAGDQLTSGNPNIPDLCDPNRPQKIGEKYSELYDNEWTDAYAEIICKSASEQKCIAILLDILKRSFVFCRERAEEQLTNIIADICLTNKRDGKIRNSEVKQLKSMRRLAAEKSNFRIQEEFIKLIRENKPFKNFGRDYTLKFTKKCTELCWYMAVQDPPLWLHWDVQHKEKLNDDMFNPYTNSGTEVDFLVWPVLKMHQDGAIVTKGVCQAIKTKKPRT